MLPDLEKAACVDVKRVSSAKKEEEDESAAFVRWCGMQWRSCGGCSGGRGDDNDRSCCTFGDGKHVVFEWRWGMQRWSRQVGRP